MWWQRKKRNPRVKDLDEINLTLKQLDTMFHNVIWARENIERMLEAIARHQEDGHECPPYCLPGSLAEWLAELPPGGVTVLLTTMLKDCVITEDAE